MSPVTLTCCVGESHPLRQNSSSNIDSFYHNGGQMSTCPPLGYKSSPCGTSIRSRSSRGGGPVCSGVCSSANEGASSAGAGSSSAGAGSCISAWTCCRRQVHRSFRPFTLSLYWAIAFSAPSRVMPKCAPAFWTIDSLEEGPSCQSPKSLVKGIPGKPSS